MASHSLRRLQGNPLSGAKGRTLFHMEPWRRRRKGDEGNWSWPPLNFFFKAIQHVIARGNFWPYPKNPWETLVLKGQRAMNFPCFCTAIVFANMGRLFCRNRSLCEPLWRPLQSYDNFLCAKCPKHCLYTILSIWAGPPIVFQSPIMGFACVGLVFAPNNAVGPTVFHSHVFFV